MGGMCDQTCWLAEACKIGPLLLVRDVTWHDVSITGRECMPCQRLSPKTVMASMKSLPTLKFTALYAGGIGMLFAVLSLRVVVFRAIQARKRHVSFGATSAGSISSNVVRVILLSRRPLSLAADSLWQFEDYQQCLAELAWCISLKYVLCSHKETWLSIMLLSFYCLPYWSSMEASATYS